jgi:hypothetical protein
MENLGLYERGILKLVLQKQWRENVDRIFVAQDRLQWRALLGSDYQLTGSIKADRFIARLSDYQIEKK